MARILSGSHGPSVFSIWVGALRGGGRAIPPSRVRPGSLPGCEQATGFALSISETLPLAQRHHPQASAFRLDRNRWRLRQQRCLEVDLGPAILAWSMRRVGLIRHHGRQRDAPSAHRNVPPRDAARRTTSLRNARAAGDTPAALECLAHTMRLLVFRSRGEHVKRNTCVRQIHGLRHARCWLVEQCPGG